MKKLLIMILATGAFIFPVYSAREAGTISVFPMAGYSFYPHIDDSNDDVKGGFEYGLGADYAFLEDWTIELTFNRSRLEYDNSISKRFDVDTWGLYGAYYYAVSETINLKAKLGMAVNKGHVTIPHYSGSGVTSQNISNYADNELTEESIGQFPEPLVYPFYDYFPLYHLKQMNAGDISSDILNYKKHSYDKTMLSGGLGIDFVIDAHSSWGVDFSVFSSYIWGSSLYYKWIF